MSDGERGIPVHLEILDPELVRDDHLSSCLLQRLYGGSRRYGSDGVRNYDTESLRHLTERLGLPEEWAFDDIANAVYMEPQYFEEARRMWKEADLNVAEQRAQFTDTTTGESVVRVIDYAADLMDLMPDFDRSEISGAADQGPDEFEGPFECERRRRPGLPLVVESEGLEDEPGVEDAGSWGESPDDDNFPTECEYLDDDD